MSFDPFSLDYFYYPVSAIMWLWYKAFAFLLGPSNFFAWTLSVMFLVFTLRAILYNPFVRQIRTTRQMQELQPQIKALQKKYGKDRQRMALEMQKLQREHGFNPILGCLPMLAQMPVFLGLYHVLRCFNRTSTGIGQLGLSPERNRELGNYVFSATDVGHFLDANLFGAPLGASMTQRGASLAAFTRLQPPGRRGSRGAGDDPGRHRHLLQQPGIGGPAEPGGRGQSADRDDEQAGAVRLPARRGGRWAVPAAGDHLLLVREQHLDVRSAALRVRDDRKRRRGKEARSDRAPGGERPGAGRQTQAVGAERAAGGNGSPATDGADRDACGPRMRPTTDQRAQQQSGQPHPTAGSQAEEAQTLTTAPIASGGDARTADLTGRGPDDGKGKRQT